jgi:hypothetical protein
MEDGRYDGVTHNKRRRPQVSARTNSPFKVLHLEFLIYLYKNIFESAFRTPTTP